MKKMSKEQVLDKCISSGKGSKYKTWEDFKSEHKNFVVDFPECVVELVFEAKQAEVLKAIDEIYCEEVNKIKNLVYLRSGSKYDIKYETELLISFKEKVKKYLLAKPAL